MSKPFSALIRELALIAIIGSFVLLADVAGWVGVACGVFAGAGGYVVGWKASR